MDLYPHQIEALSQLKNGDVLAGGVGTGKTFTALVYFVREVCGGDLDRDRPMQNPLDLIVITTAKKRDELDWENEALHVGLFRDPEISYSKKEFIVDSWNNINKYTDRENCFFIFDEQRLVGSGVWVKAFLKIAKANKWILLSATPGDTWMDYIPIFIAHGFFRNRTEFIDNHVIYTFMGKYRKIKGFYGVRHLEKMRAQILVEMPYERHTTRHLIATEVEYDRDLFKDIWQKRWNIYDHCPLVDSAEMHRLARKLVNSDPSRLDAIEKLSVEHPRMIIFYNFDYELALLRTLMPKMDIPIAEWNGHRHEDVPGTERWLYLVQYQAGSEGWNCIETDTIVYYSIPYSHRNFEQSQGRIDRLNTEFDDLYYYILMSQSKIDGLIWRSLLLKKTFHEGRNVKFVTDGK